MPSELLEINRDNKDESDADKVVAEQQRVEAAAAGSERETKA